MSSRVGVRIRVGLVLSLATAIAALACTAIADSDSPAQTRATIRGTGNDVSIVYRGAPKSPARPIAANPPQTADVLLDATRMAERGADDQSLIAFFRTHQSELPPIVENEAVRRLRKAGAGAAVISDLSRMTALDIGETAEGPPVQYAYEAPSSYETPFPSADMGYPYYGSYGGYGTGLSPRHPHGRLGSPRHGSLPVRPHPQPLPSSRSTHSGMPRFRQP